ncbi:hypothetical protein Tco_1495090 [Tanacetum coccineum]
MGDENPIRTLGDYSRPSKEGYRNTIELPKGNNVVPLRSDTICTWMTFGGNTRDFGSFGEETDKITDLHQIHEEVLFTERGDGVTGIKRQSS